MTANPTYPQATPKSFIAKSVERFKVSIAFAANPSLVRQRQYIFVLSHMRAYTTLVNHILGSNSEISGYTEAQYSYRKPKDLLKLKYATYAHGNYKPRGRYFLDKILHDSFPISELILLRPDVRCIFLIREPVATIRSIVAMWERHGRAPFYWQPPTIETAALYYTRRLASLVHMGRIMAKAKKEALVVLAEQLIEDPDAALSDITDYLNLRSALKSSYNTFERTGKAVFGDSSSVIHSRCIQKHRPEHDHIAVPTEFAEPITGEYELALAELRKCGFRWTGCQAQSGVS